MSFKTFPIVKMNSTDYNRRCSS